MLRPFRVGIAALVLLLPCCVEATSIKEFESLTRTQQSELLVNSIDKIVATVATRDDGLSRAIHDYFYVIPVGQPESPGLIAYGAELRAVRKLVGSGKLDPDKVQIEGILLDVIKTDIVSKRKNDPSK